MRHAFDQDNAGFARLDVPELSRQGHARDLGQRSGHLDSGRAAPDDHERHPGAAVLRRGLALRLFIGEEHAAADLEGVFDALEARRIAGPGIVAKIRVGRARRHDEVVVWHFSIGEDQPLAGRVEINIIEEGQARWLAFMNREIDFLDILPIDFTEQALDKDGELLPALAARGIVHDVLLRPNTWWFYFNMEDPVVGGYALEKIALRRAIAMGYDNAESIRVLLKGRAAPAYGPIPPDIAGYDPKLKTEAQLYDPELARALLDRFGYKDRDGDGCEAATAGDDAAFAECMHNRGAADTRGYCLTLAPGDICPAADASYLDACEMLDMRG